MEAELLPLAHETVVVSSDRVTGRLGLGNARKTAVVVPAQAERHIDRNGPSAFSGLFITRRDETATARRSRRRAGTAGDRVVAPAARPRAGAEGRVGRLAQCRYRFAFDGRQPHATVRAIPVSRRRVGRADRSEPAVSFQFQQRQPRPAGTGTRSPPW